MDASGLLGLIEDGGRPGLGSLGVSRSGAFDRSALRQVNTLVGNEPSTAAIEVLGGGLQLSAETTHLVAVTGGVGPLTIAGVTAPHGRALLLRAGQQLRIGTITAGLRAYVGVAGGIEVARELGSASTDTLAGLGPEPLTAGDRLQIGLAIPAPDIEDIPSLIATGEITVNVVLGPRDGWFAPESVRQLLETAWQVDPSSNRIGIRLSGPLLNRSRTEELPSEPCLRGSIQVSAEGQPIMLGPDHPVTGGYPVIAVVIDSHTDRLAQLRPGQSLRFRRR